MPKALEWDKTGEREYHSGVSKGVIWVQNADGTYKNGEAWNGLRSAHDSSEGADPNPIWADNMKYAVLYSPDDPKGSLSAYMYPDCFEECLGNASPVKGATISGQKHTPFAHCYRTEIGSDTTPEKGYILHIIYGCVAQLADVDYETQDDNPEPIEMEWEYDCTPVPVTGYNPTHHMKINSINAGAEKMAAIEAILYGSETAESRLMMPDEIITMLNS